MKYDVHMYVPARVKIEGVEAESQEDAIRLAEERFDPGNFFANADATEAARWDEGAALGYLVDEAGDEQYERTRYHEGEGAVAYVATNPGETLPSCAKLLEFVRKIANMTRDGDYRPDEDEEFEMTIDDAFETQSLCIGGARELLGLPDMIERPKDEPTS